MGSAMGRHWRWMGPVGTRRGRCLDEMWQSGFDDLSPVTRAFSRDSQKLDGNRCWTAVVTWSLTSAESVMSDSAVRGSLGNTSGLQLVVGGVVGLRAMRESCRRVVLGLSTSRPGGGPCGWRVPVWRVPRWRAPTCSPPVVRSPSWACGRQGWEGGRRSPRPAGAVQIRGRSSCGPGDHRIDHQIVQRVLASGRALLQSAASA